jgi:hypothetical protein
MVKRNSTYFCFLLIIQQKVVNSASILPLENFRSVRERDRDRGRDRGRGRDRDREKSRKH